LLWVVTSFHSLDFTDQRRSVAITGHFFFATGKKAEVCGQAKLVVGHGQSHSVTSVVCNL